MTPSDEARRLHPISPLFELIAGARQFALPFVFVLFAGRSGSSLLYLAPVVVGTVFGAVRWWRFTYRLEEGSLIIEEGVFTRTQRVLPLDRIQQVDFASKVRHRLFGVTDLRIDTAGGGAGAEVTLAVVSKAEAERLQTLLLAQPAGPAATAGEVSHSLIVIGLKRLALAGITGAEMAVMLSILLSAAQVVDDLPDSLLEDVVSRATAPSGASEFAVTAALVSLLWLGLAAAASIVKNGGFTVLRVGDDLRVRRGLFERREVSLPLHRLQAVRVQQTLLRRLLGYSAVRLQSGGSAGNDRAGVSRIDVPLLLDREVGPLLLAILPGAPPEGLVPAPAAARRRCILRRVLPLMVVAVPAGVLRPAPLTLGLVLFALAVAAAAGEAAFRGLGHAAGSGYVVARSGGLARETIVVRESKMQSTRLSTTPLQRRAGLGTLLIDIAGRGRTPAVKDASSEALESLRRLGVGDPVRRDEAETRQRAAESPNETEEAGR